MIAKVFENKINTSIVNLNEQLNKEKKVKLSQKEGPDQFIKIQANTMAENQSFLLQDFNQQNAPARFGVKCVILMKLNLKLCFWGQGMAHMF